MLPYGSHVQQLTTAVAVPNIEADFRCHCSSRWALGTCDLSVSVAGHNVSVHHAGGLHESIADGRADEAEAAFAQIFAHGVGLGRFRWHFFVRFPGVLLRLTIHK